MQFSDRVSLVSRVPKRVRDRRSAWHRQRRLKRPIAVEPRRLSGQQAAPSGNADRALAVGIGESSTAACERIESWSLNNWMPGATQQVCGPMVSRN